MKYIQRQKRATSEAGLKKIARRFWGVITREYLQNLYESMPHRIQAVIDTAKGHTKHWGIYIEDSFILVRDLVFSMTPFGVPCLYLSLGVKKAKLIKDTGLQLMTSTE